MNRDRVLSWINIIYYVLVFVLTILSIFYLRFEYGVLESNGELNKIIIYLSIICLLINVIFYFFKMQNKKNIFKNILYDMCTILFFLSGGMAWLFLLIGIFYFIIPITGIIMECENVKGLYW